MHTNVEMQYASFISIKILNQSAS